MTEEDYIGCPACGSSVAVMVTGFGIEYASCRYDCGFKWHMLIEPDPDLYNKMGIDTPIVALDELYDDIDDERQMRVLEWSDLGNSSDRGSKRTTPATLVHRRKRFFENLGKEMGIKETEMFVSYIQDYIDDKSKLQNVLYVLTAACSMDIHRTSNDVIYKIEYNQFNANAFRMNSPISIEEMTTFLKEREDILLVEVEYIPEKKEDEDKTPTLTKLYEGVIKEEKRKEDEKGYYTFAMNSEALNPMLKPSVVPFEQYRNNINIYLNYPSMIDLDNDMVYVNISHGELMRKILEKDNVDFKDFADMENKFHQNYNMVEYAVSELTGNRLLTNSNENIDKVLSLFTDDVQNLVLDNVIHDFMVLNGSGIVEGEIYIPNENEEIDIPGKILVIPTSSEEYFLPALSTIEGVGCIITERGSKTSHLVSNSKEFNFKIILVENALNIFKNEEVVSIDLDNKTIIKVES